MRGKIVDMDLLRKRNELTPAAGNARINARGDELGPGGQIVRKREDVVQEHYAHAGKVADASGRTAEFNNSTNEPQVESTAPKKTTTRTKKEEVIIEEPLTQNEQEMLNEDDEWIEDADGNFIKKGE